MMNNEKTNAYSSAHLKRTCRRIIVGFQNIRAWKYHIWLALGFLAFIIVSWALRFQSEDLTWNTSEIEYIRINLKWITIYILLFAGGCYAASRPLYARQIEYSLIEAGIVDHIGLPPQFLHYKRNKNGGDRICFYSKGIPPEEWRDKCEILETSLNIHIIDIVPGKNNREVAILATSGDLQMIESIPWKRRFMPEEAYIIACGDAYGVRIDISLRDTPHILLAGSTGSGKSWLLKLLLAQLIQKSAIVTIADFKGGIDFGAYWEEYASIITEETETVDCLRNLATGELEKRKKLLKETDCANIDEYNDEFEPFLPRMVFACDEVAELLDKTGASKERKEQIQEIEGYLSTIARLGRAVGIHLILSMQRPDANLLSGQIKNNIDGRMCGKSEDTLSMIVLDNTDASRRIPKTSHGIFINQDGIMFKAFSLPPEYK